MADGRGPLSVYETLTQHINALRVIAKNNKPFEPNISHHFSFRGSDDLSGIVATCPITLIPFLLWKNNDGIF